MTRGFIAIAAALVALYARDSPAPAQPASVEIAFIANSGDATVALLNVGARSIVGRIDVNPRRVKASGPGAANYAQDTDISPDGETLCVSRAYMGDVAAFDIVTGKLLWNTPLNTGRADGKLLYNTSIGAIKTLPRSPNAAPLTETPGAPFQITVVDVNTMETRERIPTDNAIRPWQFAPDEKGLYAQLANQHAVAFYDLTTRKFTRRLELPVKAGITVADYDFEVPHHSR